MPSIISRYRTWLNRTRAQRAYHAASHAAGGYLAELGSAYAPAYRANLYLLTARELSPMATLHNAGFGVDLLDDGTTMAEAHAWEPLLFTALYTVERSLAEGKPRLRLADAVGELLPADMRTADVAEKANRIEEAGGRILDRMVQAPLVSDRAHMARAELAEALRPVVGIQAGEALATLRAPVLDASKCKLAA